jgi:hypothetical protein
MLVIPAFRRLGKEDPEFEARLDCTERLSQKKKFKQELFQFWLYAI